MNHDWFQEEDILAFDDVEPFIPPTGPSAELQANPMPSGNKPQSSPPDVREPVPSPLRSVADQYDPPPYWSRRATDHEWAKPREAERVPCCTGAIRVSLQHYGRRVLCLPCKTIYRFGRPIGHAPVANFGLRHRS
ncbi:hypothetical protein [Candidatus Entotheonella palauensis]|uniref:Uncharacterized protein n=1 Tax=Candidatus Entotheonella gemina TaxID=1429439 RepID=W4M769_9BACT|nr:hypothetical protein [Candidatus Entotheonella palauensis]ETX06050.1 MAG: hypothetical protein ETSY2_19360 [Candidatus Entotheonella gemina]